MAPGARFFISLVVGLCSSTEYALDPEIQDIHKGLSWFWSKGQLFIENLPPLSFWNSVLFPPWLLVSVGVSCRVLVYHLVIARFCGRSSRPSHPGLALSHSLVCVGIAISCLRVGDHQAANMLDYCNVSESIIAGVLLLASSSDLGVLGTVCLQSGLLDCLLVLAWGLGHNLVDLILSFVIVYFATTTSVLRRPKHQAFGSELALVVKLVFCTIRSLILPCILYIALLGVVFPHSEVAAGGNYNLHYLSAEARRSLSPVREKAEIPNWGNHSLPLYAVVPYVPVSLYLPRAGFLWHDESVWLPELGLFGTERELSGYQGLSQAEDASPDSTLYRVHFSDPIASRHPWSFEQALYDDIRHRTDHNSDYARSHLWSGEMVHIRSRITKHYLGVAGDQKSLIDEELEIDHGDEPFTRLRVGGLQMTSPNTTWRIDYDPDSDNGFRLFNVYQNCYLASSFRLYPDWDGERGNDTVNAQIHQYVEATCTRFASEEASTLFLVEGLRKERSRNVLRRTALISPIQDVVVRGYHLATGLVSLHHTRTLYGETLDMPRILLHHSAQGARLAQILESILPLVFIFVHIISLLRSRRVPPVADINILKVDPRPVDHPLVSQRFASCILVYGHFLFYHVVGFARPFGGRLALLFAVLGLGEILGRN